MSNAAERSSKVNRNIATVRGYKEVTGHTEKCCLRAVAGAVSGLKSARKLVLFRCSVDMLCNHAVPGSPSPFKCSEGH